MIEVDAHKNRISLDCQKFSQTRHDNPLGELRVGRRRGTSILDSALK
ncbi:hypothetical protein [Rhizobium leguminosarum]|nr:hypothetical protein [Rhizobium leguminosarum]MBY5324178.1 hypothetical protein [Rhizobium leguminosarum]MBY5392182.1 hypothetical protein [Rhizobium leguminosarum]MBY5433942.1 hypothetical protein [Rhizobium leguminosarum]NEH74359.1 hypothetical protein [Rhizobium leguminosarum]NEK45762.1 hypothetical protein [Rhizobium leguminosarum]